MSALFSSNILIEQKFSSENIEETKFGKVLVVINNIDFHVLACKSPPLDSCKEKSISSSRPT